MQNIFINIIRQRKVILRLFLLALGVAIYYVLNLQPIKNAHLAVIAGKLTDIYIIVMVMVTVNSLMLGFLDLYNRKDKTQRHPLKGLVQGIQVGLYFIGAILIIAVLIDKSPAALLTGLGASAAVLMLVFKDSILGFVSGIQLSQNNMIRIGDWIQMPDGSANGTVEEVTLNTVKVRNWDNTITTIPPYTLVSTPFRNWRGMQESGGRRVDKMIYLDIRSITVCTDEMLGHIKEEIPLMSDYTIEYNPTNSQLYREYIGRYLRSLDVVAQELDLIIAQREVSRYGMPVEVYFFLKEKSWSRYETIQSDIFDHLLAMAPEFGLKIYQRAA